MQQINTMLTDMGVGPAPTAGDRLVRSRTHPNVAVKIAGESKAERRVRRRAAMRIRRELVLIDEDLR